MVKGFSFGIRFDMVYTDSSDDAARFIFEEIFSVLTTSDLRGIEIYGGMANGSDPAENGIYTEPCELRSYTFERQLDDMHDLLAGGEMKESYDSFIRPVFILEALDASIRSGKIEPVRILPV